MQTFDYDCDPDDRLKLGLVVLQADRTIEDDMRSLLPANASLLVSRVPSGVAVTSESLAEMEDHLTGAACLFPRGHRFDVVGYACTSGTAQIGASRIAELVSAGTEAGAVTDPVSALLAACQAAGLNRLALLSPYVASVSDRLRSKLHEAGVETPVFGSFDEVNEAKVAEIGASSIERAAAALVRGAEVDGVFLSCTNLRTLAVSDSLQLRLGVPVLSSNLVLAWHMLVRANAAPRLPQNLLAE